MKKSEIYRGLQTTVLKDMDIPPCSKVEILRELFIQEDLAKFAEEQEGEGK